MLTHRKSIQDVGSTISIYMNRNILNRGSPEKKRSKGLVLETKPHGQDRRYEIWAKQKVQAMYSVYIAKRREKQITVLQAAFTSGEG